MSKRKTMAQLRAEQAVETPDNEIPGETPEDTTDETPTETPVETPVETPEETPAETATPAAQAPASTKPAAAAPAVKMVSIAESELNVLRADAAEWQAKKEKLGMLNTWYGNMAKAGVTPEKDASDVQASTKYQSKGMALANRKAEKYK